MFSSLSIHLHLPLTMKFHPYITTNSNVTVLVRQVGFPLTNEKKIEYFKFNARVQVNFQIELFQVFLKQTKTSRNKIFKS